MTHRQRQRKQTKTHRDRHKRQRPETSHSVQRACSHVHVTRAVRASVPLQLFTSLSAPSCSNLTSRRLQRKKQQDRDKRERLRPRWLTVASRSSPDTPMGMAHYSCQGCSQWQPSSMELRAGWVPGALRDATETQHRWADQVRHAVRFCCKKAFSTSQILLGSHVACVMLREKTGKMIRRYASCSTQVSGFADGGRIERW